MKNARNHMKNKWLLIMMALVLLLTACAPQEAQGDPTLAQTDSGAYSEDPAVQATPRPITRPLRDALGRDVEVMVNPTRVISLSPATTEILYALDCGSKVVAVDTNSNYPNEVDALPKLDPKNVQEIIKMKPHVVFVSRAYDTVLMDEMQDAGISVVCAEAATYEELYGNISLVGLVMDKDSAQLVLDMQDVVQNVDANANELEEVDVYFALGFSADAHISAGEGTLVSTLIKAAGGKPVMTETAQVVTYTTEQLIKLNPQVVLVASSLDLNALKNFEGYKDLDAVQAGRIYVIDEELLRPGPRVVEGIQQIYEALEMSAVS